MTTGVADEVIPVGIAHNITVIIRVTYIKIEFAYIHCIAKLEYIIVVESAEYTIIHTVVETGMSACSGSADGAYSSCWGKRAADPEKFFRVIAAGTCYITGSAGYSYYKGKLVIVGQLVDIGIVITAHIHPSAKIVECDPSIDGVICEGGYRAAHGVP